VGSGRRHWNLSQSGRVMRRFVFRHFGQWPGLIGTLTCAVFSAIRRSWAPPGARPRPRANPFAIERIGSASRIRGRFFTKLCDHQLRRNKEGCSISPKEGVVVHFRARCLLGLEFHHDLPDLSPEVPSSQLGPLRGATSVQKETGVVTFKRQRVRVATVRLQACSVDNPKLRA
jgi:hypothetical protein